MLQKKQPSLVQPQERRGQEISCGTTDCCATLCNTMPSDTGIINQSFSSKSPWRAPAQGLDHCKNCTWKAAGFLTHEEDGRDGRHLLNLGWHVIQCLSTLKVTQLRNSCCPLPEHSFFPFHQALCCTSKQGCSSKLNWNEAWKEWRNPASSTTSPISAEAHGSGFSLVYQCKNPTFG